MKYTTHYCAALLLSVFAFMIPADQSEARFHSGFGIGFTNVVPARPAVYEVHREVYNEPIAIVEEDVRVCPECNAVRLYPGYHERYVRIPSRSVVRETVVVHRPRPVIVPTFSFGFGFFR